LKLERGKINGLELTTLIAGFLFGSAVLLFPGQWAEHEGWIAILGGVAEGFVFMLLYAALMSRFPGKNFVEIAKEVYGPFFGSLVALAFIGYLFHLGSLVVTDYHDFIKLTMLVQTPSSMIVLVNCLVIIYGVKKGIEVIARCSQGMVTLLCVFYLMIFGMLSMQIKWTNFQPFFSLPVTKVLWAAHMAGSFPFGETVAFLMVFPTLNKPEELLNRSLKALFLAGIYFFIGSIRTIGVLGDTARLFLYSGFQSGRLINIANVFTRLEIIIGVNFLMMGFLKIAVLLYGCALGIAQLFNLKSYSPLVLPLGLLMGMLGMINFSMVSENFEFSSLVYPVFAFPFQVIIPLTTLVVALIRKLPKKGDDDN